MLNAIHKNTSDTQVSHRQSSSTYIAYVADAYIPNGNTVGHPMPANRRIVAYASGAIHSVATTHVTIVTARTPSAIGPGIRMW